MVSPRTLKTRPKVSFPTGTEIGRPVSKTSIPRVKPSVDSMAMVRTTPSPSSKATSRTTFDFVGHFIDYKRIIDLRKFISNGKGNVYDGTYDLEKFCLNSCHSPILSNFYCSKVLFRASVLYKNCIRQLFKGASTCNDFGNFLCNRCLTSTVVLNR